MLKHPSALCNLNTCGAYLQAITECFSTVTNLMNLIRYHFQSKNFILFIFLLALFANYYTGFTSLRFLIGLTALDIKNVFMKEDLIDQLHVELLGLQALIEFVHKALSPHRGRFESARAGVHGAHGLH